MATLRSELIERMNEMGGPDEDPEIVIALVDNDGETVLYELDNVDDGELGNGMICLEAGDEKE